MNLLNVQGVFGIAVGIIGVAFIADAAQQMSMTPITGGSAGAYSVPSLDVEGLFGMAARAGEMQASDDLSDLLRIDLPNADIAVGDYVGTNVYSTATVKKIAYGNVSNVNVYSTSTGAYSTDGLTSPHVQYPGIAVSDRPTNAFMPLGGYVWEGAFGWIPVPHGPTRSFLTYSVPETGTPSTSGGMECAERSGVLVCG